MNEKSLVPVQSWLIEPLERPVADAIARLRRAPDVQRIVIMPDVHMASDVCVGVAVGTSQLIYPQAVGGDIGCGMLAIAFDSSSQSLRDATVAGRVLAGIGKAIPTIRRHRRATMALPEQLRADRLSHSSLNSVLREDGALQFGTLGSGNHFIELQADEEDRLWLMIHSGSRAMGQAIRAHHMGAARSVGSGLKALDATTETGRAYLHDMEWARRYADANRRAMAERVDEALRLQAGAALRWDSMISIDHNHVRPEVHAGESLWVHRKGAMPAAAGLMGVVPGSMGTGSFHVEGRGCERSMDSSAHGAGRSLSREMARRAITERDVQAQMQGIWYDFRMARDLREEAPRAYKDVRAVMRAQSELVKIVRVLQPLLNYKGR